MARDHAPLCVADRQQALVGGTHHRKTVLDAAYDGDTGVDPGVDDEVVGRNRHHSDVARERVVAQGVGEVHVFAHGHRITAADQTGRAARREVRLQARYEMALGIDLAFAAGLQRDGEVRRR